MTGLAGDVDASALDTSPICVEKGVRFGVYGVAASDSLMVRAPVRQIRGRDATAWASAAQAPYLSLRVPVVPGGDNSVLR